MFNEAETISSTLEELVGGHQPDEVIVADGGSSDKTVELASGWARVVASPKGRAKQLNRGAEAAGGDIFLFLHADTKLPPRGLEAAKKAIGEGKEAGRFRLRFSDPHWLLRIYSFYTRFQMFSYGDQAFFVTRELFETLEGFEEDVPFEDIDFYRRLRKLTRPVILKEQVTTSARRFTQVGLFRQKLINILLVCLDGFGFEISSLKERLYTDVR